MSVFKLQEKSHLQRKMFLDGTVDLARYDQVKYPQFEKLIDKQEGFFWRPQEVTLKKDERDFKTLSDHEKHIFTSNLKRQILLDSVQGRAPALVFLPIVSLPELEAFITVWSDFERIHNKSYTHILKNVYPNPSLIYDEMLDNKEIFECAKSISKYYDELAESWHARSHDGYFKYDTKKSLWKCLHAVNALEGIRFYVSFACSWAFAETKRMEGNAKIIKLIARDENLHLAATQQIIKLLPIDDHDYIDIKQICEDEIVQMFREVVEQEKNWAKYLFQAGSIIGLNEELLCDYVEWIAHKRMLAIGIDSPYKGGSNPLPWTQSWIGGSDVQVRPQETELTNYELGGIKRDATPEFYEKLKI